MPKVGPDWEIDLVLRIGEGDRAAQEDLFNAHSPYLLAALRRSFPMLRQEDIEEVCLDAFFKAIRSIGRYDERKSSLRTWLFRIARNCAIDRLREQQSRGVAAERERPDEYWASVPGGPEADPEGSSTSPDARTMQNALEELTETERAILLADAQCVPDVADAKLLGRWLGRPAATIRQYRKRAREKVRAYFRKHDRRG